MRHLSVRLLKSAFKAFAYSLVGGLIVLIAGLIGYLESRPDLSAWHETVLDGEFTEHAPVKDFAGYLALEAQL
ncbi:MAG: alpha/beta hydrolase, partial [Candidatus Competibacteraceae bacterium]|nr:alpha/beta hydrolase [Candidatus Competibacteraceae bacterium]